MYTVSSNSHACCTRTTCVSVTLPELSTTESGFPLEQDHHGMLHLCRISLVLPMCISKQKICISCFNHPFLSAVKDACMHPRGSSMTPSHPACSRMPPLPCQAGYPPHSQGTGGQRAIVTRPSLDSCAGKHEISAQSTWSLCSAKVIKMPSYKTSRFPG
jgi:hypothetical protein